MFERSLKLELLNLCFLYVSKLISIVFVKIKERIALDFILAYKTPFCKPEVLKKGLLLTNSNKVSLDIYLP